VPKNRPTDYQPYLVLVGLEQAQWVSQVELQTQKQFLYQPYLVLVGLEQTQWGTEEKLQTQKQLLYSHTWYWYILKPICSSLSSPGLEIWSYMICYKAASITKPTNIIICTRDIF
jgi:hypothetical protein